MSQPPEPPNPYESPHSQAAEDAGEPLPEDLARWARRGSMTYDVTVVIGAIVYLAVLGFAGSTLVTIPAVAVGLRASGSIAAWYWMCWCAMFLARFPGQFLCGWMVGRFLRRINPWSVAAGVAIWMGLGCVWLIASADRGNRGYVAEIGLSAYVVQVIANVLVAWAVVFGATWLGRNGQRAADARSATTDGCPRVLAMKAASFSVGTEEVHEIGVLHLASGREIYTVDGREELNKRSFWSLRGSRRLSVGDRESHEIVIRWRPFPFPSTQAFVDGELAVEELFPDTRLLLRVGVIVLAILVALGLAMGLAVFALHLAF